MLNTLAQIGSMLGIPIFFYSVLWPCIKKEKDKYETKQKKIEDTCYSLINELYEIIRRRTKDKTLQREMLVIFKNTIFLGEKYLYRSNKDDFAVLNLFCDGEPAGVEYSLSDLFRIKIESDKVFICLNKKYSTKRYTKILLKRIETYLEWFYQDNNGDKKL